MLDLVRKGPEKWHCCIKATRNSYMHRGKTWSSRAEAGFRDVSWNNDILAEVFFWILVALADETGNPVL